MQLLEAALRYAELGYPVFPCRPGSKKPATVDGFKSATLDLEKIERYWSQNPDANIGIATAGFLVVDVDPGAEWPPKERAMDLSQCPIAMTPRGGCHYWMAGAARSTVSRLAANVDTRSDGGYVLVPPSMVAEKPYSWVTAPPPKEQLPQAPAWILEAFQAPAKAKTEHLDIAETAVIPEGQRNGTLTRLAGYLRRVGMTEPEIAAALEATNRRRCRPPLDPDELRTIAHSVARYAPDDGAKEAIESSPEQPATASRPAELPEEAYDVPGIMDIFMRWTCVTAMYRQPELTLAAAIALMAAITGRKICDRNNGRTNLYVLSVAAAGAGKNHPRVCVKTLLARAGGEALCGPEDVSSGPAILATLRRSPCSLMLIDEVGKVLKAAVDPRAPAHLASIVTDLLRLYSSAGSNFAGKAYADLERDNLRIEQPHLVVLGSTTPDSLYSSLTTESLRDGLISRMLVFEASNNDPPPRDVEWRDPPAHLVAQVREWVEFMRDSPTHQLDPRPQVVQTEPDAAKVLKAFRGEAHDRRKSGCREVWVRAHEFAVKLAMLYAASTGPGMPVTKAAADWGCLIARHSAETMAWRVEKDVAETERERAAKRILEMIRQAGGAGVTKREITRASQKLNRSLREEILADLEESEQVWVERLGQKVVFVGR